MFSRIYLLAGALLTRAKLRILPAKMETTMKSTELIMQDHTILRRGMDILDGMGKKLEDGERIEVADVTTLLRFFRVFGEYHQNMEEKVFFPVLLCAVSEQIPVHVLLSEHVQELMITAEIEEALKSKRGMSFFQATRRLSSLLRNHFDQEDAIFPDLTRRWLSKEQDSEVADRLAKIHKQPEIPANFSRLECKYVSRRDRAPMPSQRLARRHTVGAR